MEGPQFYFQEYKPGYYWSQKTQSYYYSKDIGNQVWLSKTELCKGELLPLRKIIEIVQKKNIKEKNKRDFICRFSTKEFPVIERIGYDKFNGTILIDLDLQHSYLFEEIQLYKEYYYNKFDEYFKKILPDNYLYIETSSSGYGIHALFWFKDYIKDEIKFKKTAQYVFNKISEDKEIRDIIFKIRENDKGKVLDPIYNRAYQKCFFTGINPKIYDISGVSNKDEIDKIEIITVDEKLNEKVNYEIKSFKKFDGQQIEIDHNTRFYIATALKKVTPNKETWTYYWSEICKYFKPEKSTDSYQYFFNQFQYESLKTDKARPEILRKYGFDISNVNIIHNLSLNGEKRYLGDIREEILSEVPFGITLLRAPTGSGKTVCWVIWNRKLIKKFKDSFPFEGESFKPILVIEPLNSIIETKYCKDEVCIVNKSKRFPSNINQYTMYVTNYNKLITKTLDGKYVMKEGIDKFLEQFSYIIIDESHIIIKDSFRCNVLIPFIETINKAAKNCHIILQTATPMDEDKIFDIKQNITVTKPLDKDIKYIIRKFPYESVDDKGEKVITKFCLGDLLCLIKYYRNRKRKIYIYWPNISAANIKSLKSVYDEPDKIAFYHKRLQDDESMRYITENHKLGDLYDILISSVYFGVGNDLDDEDDTAVIIIGNHTWQEDIQAIGRWRNSKNIEVCQIITDNNEYDFLKETKDNNIKYNEIFNRNENYYTSILHDKFMRGKSVMINGKSFMINTENDIYPLSVMQTALEYNSSYHIKMDNLSNPYYGYRVKPDIDRLLENNIEYLESLTSYWDKVKSIRDFKKKDIIKNGFNKEDIESDSNIQRWYNNVWRYIKTYKLDNICNSKYLDDITKTSLYNNWKLYIDFYKNIKNSKLDLPEFYGLLWTRNKIKQIKDKDEVLEINGNKLNIFDYYYIFGYVLWYAFYEKDTGDKYIMYNYFKDFIWKCKLLKNIPDEYILEYFKIETLKYINEYDNTIPYDIEDLYNMNPFIKETYIPNLEYVYNKLEYNQDKVNKIVYKCIEFINDSKVKGKIGGKIGSPKKKCIVTEKFKNPSKYGLSIGQEFESASDLAEFTGKSNKTITQWRSKNWIK